MAQLICKENITIVAGTYPDPQNPQAVKNRYRTIGELVTMQDDQGQQYKFGEIWGPHGYTKFNVYPQDQQQAAAPQQQQAPQQHNQQQVYNNAPPQGAPAQQQRGGYNSRRG